MPIHVIMAKAGIRQRNKTLQAMSPESQGNGHYLLFVAVCHKKVFASGSESLFRSRLDSPLLTDTHNHLLHIGKINHHTL